jgi:drug/metabolite transporter (DMT)-like permease
MNQAASVPHPRERLDSLALAAGLLAPLTWGMTGVFVRLLHGVPTLAIADVRLLIAALVLSPWAFRRRHPAGCRDGCLLHFRDRSVCSSACG